MRLLTIATAATFAIGLAGAASAQGLSVEPGEWETTTAFTGKVTAQGMTFNLPGNETTSTNCITEEDAAMKPEDMAGETCTASNVKSSGNSVSFDIDCSQEGSSMTGTMQTTAGPDGKSVTGKMTMTGSQEGSTVDMTGNYSGKWIGTCS